MRLNGLSKSRAELYGKPHIGDCWYQSPSSISAKKEQGALCQICGRPASEAHHLSAKGMGGGNTYITTERGLKVRSACITVCGRGNASGCHGLFHQGLIRARWEWDVPEYEALWWSDELIERFGAHSPELYAFGSWLLELPGGVRRFRE